jgi:solute carrier family 6 (neurotransmitter transporter, glycine) member 5/9
LGLIDFYGATFVAFILAVAELIVFCYIYGVNRICKDVEFMLNRKMGIYWKICWRFLTPGLMTVIAIYTLWNFELPKDGDYDFPVIAHVIGWSVAAICLSQVVIFAVYKLSHTNNYASLWEVKDTDNLMLKYENVSIFREFCKLQIQHLHGDQKIH